MKITSRKTHSFIELQVDEIETILFKSHPEVEGMIYNLLEIANDLASYTDKSLKDYLTSSQTEISDEEIEKAADNYGHKWIDAREAFYGFLEGAKWYREQLKSRVSL